MTIDIAKNAAQKAARENYITGLAEVNMKFISEATAAEITTEKMLEEVISNLVSLATYYAVTCMHREDFVSGCGEEFDDSLKTLELMERGKSNA
jgi:hypothetical protein